MHGLDSVYYRFYPIYNINLYAERESNLFFQENSEAYPTETLLKFTCDFMLVNTVYVQVFAEHFFGNSPI